MSVSADKFKKALDSSGLDIEWMSGWKNTWHGMSKWRGKNGNPVALMLHHTAGASTESVDSSHKGNKCSADEGQKKFVHRHPSFLNNANRGANPCTFNIHYNIYDTYEYICNINTYII